jgi:hypothetical protein
MQKPGKFWLENLFFFCLFKCTVQDTTYTRNPFLDLFFVLKYVKNNVFKRIPDLTLVLNETVESYRYGNGHISEIPSYDIGI